MTNLPFQVVGSHSEKWISLPMTPSTLQSATGVATGAAAVIRTSGALKPVIASHASCASAGAAPPATSPKAPSAAKERRIIR